MAPAAEKILSVYYWMESVEKEKNPRQDSHSGKQNLS